MTVKELRDSIRRLTREVNIRIAEYRSMHTSDDAMFTKIVDRLKLASGVSGGYEGGEIGLGISRKNKAELTAQLKVLERFKAKEWFSSTANTELEGRYKQSYNTFVKNHGYVSENEWDSYVTMLSTMGSYLAGYGYESIEGSMANLYVDATPTGKRRMGRYIREVGKKMKGRGVVPEDFIEALASKMIDDGTLDRDQYE